MHFSRHDESTSARINGDRNIFAKGQSWYSDTVTFRHNLTHHAITEARPKESNKGSLQQPAKGVVGVSQERHVIRAQQDRGGLCSHR